MFENVSQLFKNILFVKILYMANLKNGENSFFPARETIDKEKQIVNRRGFIDLENCVQLIIIIFTKEQKEDRKGIER